MRNGHRSSSSFLFLALPHNSQPLLLGKLTMESSRWFGPGGPSSWSYCVNIADYGLAGGHVVVLPVTLVVFVGAIELWSRGPRLGLTAWI